MPVGLRPNASSAVPPESQTTSSEPKAPIDKHKKCKVALLPLSRETGPEECQMTCSRQLTPGIKPISGTMMAVETAMEVVFPMKG